MRTLRVRSVVSEPRALERGHWGRLYVRPLGGPRIGVLITLGGQGYGSSIHGIDVPRLQTRFCIRAAPRGYLSRRHRPSFHASRTRRRGRLKDHAKLSDGDAVVVSEEIRLRPARRLLRAAPPATLVALGGRLLLTLRPCASWLDELLRAILALHPIVPLLVDRGLRLANVALLEAKEVHRRRFLGAL